jgi:DNA polymerase-3 subunit delta'
MSFSNIFCQDTPIKTIRRSLVSGKTPHAYLFSGPSGVGKHTTARTLAAALNCTESADDACGLCNSCRKVDKDVHPDVFEVTLPAAKKSIPVDSIRELEHRLALRPHEGRAKVVIVDPADMMTEASANALLKTLEEPKPGRYLILITSRLSYLLPTVRSRCQIVRFGALSSDTVEKLLLEVGVLPEKAGPAAALSDGSMTRGMSYADDTVVERVENLLQFISSAVDSTPLSGLSIVENLKKEKAGVREEALALIQTAPMVLSEILWLSTHSDRTVDERPLTRVFGDRLIPLSGRLTAARIADFVFAFHHAEQAILNNNMNPQLALEGVLMSMRSPSRRMGEGSGFKRA